MCLWKERVRKTTPTEANCICFQESVFRDRETWSVSPHKYATVLVMTSLENKPGETTGSAYPAVPVPHQSSQRHKLFKHSGWNENRCRYHSLASTKAKDWGAINANAKHNYKRYLH